MLFISESVWLWYEIFIHNYLQTTEKYPLVLSDVINMTVPECPS